MQHPLPQVPLVNSAFAAGDAMVASLLIKGIRMKKHLEWAAKLAARLTGKKRPKKSFRRVTDIGTTMGLDVSEGTINFSGLYSRVRAVCDNEFLKVGLYSPSWMEFDESYLVLVFSRNGKIAMELKEGALAFISSGDREIQARLVTPVAIICWSIGIDGRVVLADNPKLARIYAEKV